MWQIICALAVAMGVFIGMVIIAFLVQAVGSWCVRKFGSDL
jgi:hypothetical protein